MQIPLQPVIQIINQGNQPAGQGQQTNNQNGTINQQNKLDNPNNETQPKTNETQQMNNDTQSAKNETETVTEEIYYFYEYPYQEYYLVEPVYYDPTPVYYSSYEPVCMDVYDDVLYTSNDVIYDIYYRKNNEGSKPNNLDEVSKEKIGKILDEQKAKIYGENSKSTVDLRKHNQIYSRNWLEAQLRVSKAIFLEDRIRELKKDSF